MSLEEIRGALINAAWRLSNEICRLFPLSEAAAQARQEREAVGELRRMVELIKEFRVVTFTLDPDGVYYEAGEGGKHSYGVLMRGEDG